MDIRITELAHRAVRAIESIAKSQQQQVEALEKQNRILESIAKNTANTKPNPNE